jgi:hypothetical protein
MLDLLGLLRQLAEVEHKLGEFLEKVEEALEEQQEPGATEEEATQLESPEEEGVRPEDRQRIDQLFAQAGRDRSKAYELKRELDRLKLYKDYEDRFLDLFKKP